jgi:hypothetical protein
MWLCSTQQRQSPRSFTLDQRLESFVDQPGFLLDTGVGLCFREKFVVEGDGRAHVRSPMARNMASIDADFNA